MSVRGGGGRLAYVVEERGQPHDQPRRRPGHGEQRVAEHIVGVISALLTPLQAVTSGRITSSNEARPGLES